MPFLQSCINETQRMFTVAQADRVAEKNFEFKGMKIKKGTPVIMSLYGLTHDETVFPEPENFLPERERPNDSFTPFGSGPRACIAQRFALTEIKLVFVSILSKYKFVKTSNTFEVPVINKSYFGRSEKPIHLKVVRREY